MGAMPIHPMNMCSLVPMAKSCEVNRLVMVFKPSGNLKAHMNGEADEGED